MRPINELVHDQIIQSAGLFNVTNLKPFTEYMVKIEAVNDRNLSSSIVKTILTVETCKCFI